MPDGVRRWTMGSMGGHEPNDGVGDVASVHVLHGNAAPAVPRPRAADDEEPAGEGEPVAADEGGAQTALHAAMGAASVVGGIAAGLGRSVGRVARPVTRTVLHPPLLDESLHPARLVEGLAARGRTTESTANREMERLIAAIVPPVVDEVLATLDLNEIVAQHVDIGAIVDTVDIDAIVDRVDIPHIVQRLDLNEIVAGLDLNSIIDRVDIAAVAARVDVNAIADKIDISAILDRVNIDAIAAQIDLDAIASRIDIDAIAGRIDIEAILNRVDIVAIAEEVVDGIDLPEIIRESTGSFATEAVRDVRMQGIEADEAVARLLDRLLLRRKRRHTDAPGEPRSLEGEPEPPPLDGPPT